MISKISEKEKTQASIDNEGICIMVFDVESGMKTREIAQVNKLHYSIGTNEFIKYISNALKHSDQRTLRKFMENYRFAESATMDIYGTKLSLYKDLKIFDSTQNHLEVFQKQINQDFHIVQQNIEFYEKNLEDYSFTYD